MLKLYPKNNPIDRLQEVVRVLEDGGIIVYPTGTTYALGCHALKERAVERICRLRGIDPAIHPLSVICYDMSAISEYAHISTPVYKVMKRNLPGPFTFILRGKNKLPKVFRTKKNGEIGIRMPQSPILCDVMNLLGEPLMTSSLPTLGDGEMEFQLNPELIEEALGDQVDLVIDGGMGMEGMTTVVNCQDDELEIIRQGDGELV